MVWKIRSEKTCEIKVGREEACVMGERRCSVFTRHNLGRQVLQTSSRASTLILRLSIEAREGISVLRRLTMGQEWEILSYRFDCRNYQVLA